MRLNTVRRGAGEPIVFLHGLGTSAETWATGMDLLADRYTVVAIDLLGHGGSPVPDDPAEYTRDAALNDIDEVLAELDRPAVLVGHSLGRLPRPRPRGHPSGRHAGRGRAEHRAGLSRPREA